MRLSTLVEDDLTVPEDARDLDIAGLTADSRRAGPGYLFVALAGARLDGARFASDAVARGAVAVLAESSAVMPDVGTVPVLRSPEPRRALALMAARFAGAQPRVAVAVTGTSGKTSVAEFTRQIFRRLGRSAASLGTIGLIKPDGAVYGALTTPDPIALHATLASLAKEGVTHLAFEASSHGLDQHRLDGVTLTAAAFTNLGRDHMDYHPTIEHYLGAKLRLFSQLLRPSQPAVINADGAMSAEVVAVARRRGLDVLTVGRHGEALRLESAAPQGFKQRLAVRWQNRVHTIVLPLIGAYQVENALVAAGLAIAAGEDGTAVLGALESLEGVKGRLEIAGEVNGGLVVIDYAHKPDALAAALDACRPFASGALICVFGCGGDRDKGKRPIMGRIAAEKADTVIVTDDNPRSERPEAIRSEILADAPRAREIGDRRAAIRTAIGMLGRGDVVLIAGKGHETGQIVGDRVLPFSDHDEAEAMIRSLRAHG